MTKKNISVVLPCYNEEGNVEKISNDIIKLFKKELSKYNYEIIFIDNDSKDNTRNILRKMCKKNKNIKAIFNAKNFGQFNSPYYALLQSSGDAVISMASDFQDPVDMLPKFVSAWEEGYKIAVVTDIGLLNDGGFNQGTYEGAKSYAEKTGNYPGP